MSFNDETSNFYYLTNVLSRHKKSVLYDDGWGDFHSTDFTGSNNRDASLGFPNGAVDYKTTKNSNPDRPLVSI